ncbi:MAG: YiiD C-terminal domain-containing protein [Chromatiales bacterium]
MEVISVAFIEKVGIAKDAAGHLMLDLDESLESHVHTIHSGALFTLAEAASGEALQVRFPSLADHVVPVIRDAQITYRQPATTLVTAYPSISDEAVQQFEQRFARKNRATIAVEVDVVNCSGVLVCNGTFNWLILGNGRADNRRFLSTRGKIE